LHQYEAEQQRKEMLKPKEEPKADKPIVEEQKEPEKPVADTKLYSYKFQVVGTKAQLDALVKYLNSVPFESINTL
jgi:hypothetical protein